MFKMGYSYTKMGLMKRQNQTEAASPVITACATATLCNHQREQQQQERWTANSPKTCLELSVKKE